MIQNFQKLFQQPKLSAKFGLTLIAIFALSGAYVLLRTFALDNHKLDLETFEGELTVLHSDDFVNSVSREAYFLTNDDGQKNKLEFSGEKPALLSGSRVKIRAKLTSSNTLTVSTARLPNFEVLQEAQPHHSPRKQAVILYNFANSADDPQTTNINEKEPLTKTDAKSKIFTDPNSVNAYYKETSFGDRSLVGVIDPIGDVFGWYTINYNSVTSATCKYPDDLGNWAAAAQNAAKVDGFNLANYDHVLYLSALGGNAYPCEGGGDLGGKNAWAGALSLDWQAVAIHEIGHNFGAHHSNHYECTDSTGRRVSISSSCTSVEYGDPFDVMGVRLQRHMNGFNKDRLLWLDLPNTASINKSGDYALAPIENSSTGVQVLKIYRDNSGPGGRARYYEVEFRRAYGFDSFLSSDPVVNGVTIRLAPDEWFKTNLIDTTPETPALDDAPLSVGKTFSDPITGISITTNSISSTAASVHVGMSNSATTHIEGLIGVYRPSNKNFYVNNTLPPVAANTITRTIGPYSGKPYLCEFVYPYLESVGLLIGNNFYIKAVRDSSANAPVYGYTYGANGDVPLCGDWDGDGDKTIGVKRGNTYYLSNDNKVAAKTFSFGQTGDTPIVGDWNGDRTDTIGVFRANTFYLKNSHSGGTADLTFAFGKVGDKPVAGDWDNDGISTIGVVRGNTWYLKNSLSGGNADISFTFGKVDDIPMAITW